MTWMVRIIGHDFALRDWHDNLKAPFDPFVEVVQLPGENGNLIDAYVLASTQFSACIDHRKVRELANCLTTTVYITLPDNVLGSSIEQHIRDEFPGVVMESWEYQMDDPTDDGTAKPLNVASAVVKHMQNQPLGRYAVNEVAFDLGFNVGQKSALKDGLKKKRKVFDDLAAIGVAYVVEGKSKGAKSYLVKNG